MPMINQAINMFLNEQKKKKSFTLKPRKFHCICAFGNGSTKTKIGFQFNCCCCCYLGLFVSPMMMDQQKNKRDIPIWKTNRPFTTHTNTHGQINRFEYKKKFITIIMRKKWTNQRACVQMSRYHYHDQSAVK